MDKAHVLLVQDDEGKKNYSSFFVETDNPNMVLEQLREAVQDYCKDIYAKGDEPFIDFNWTDAIKEMPNEAWEKHGIEKLPISSVFTKNDLPKLTLNVDSREVLLPNDMKKELQEKNDKFKGLIQKIVESYQPSPESKAKGLEKILSNLKNSNADKPKPSINKSDDMQR